MFIVVNLKPGVIFVKQSNKGIMLIQKEQKSKKGNYNIRLVKSYGNTYSIHDSWNRFLKDLGEISEKEAYIIFNQY